MDAENITLDNVQITAATGLEVRNAKGIDFKNVKITVKKGEPVMVKDATVSGLESAPAPATADSAPAAPSTTDKPTP